jgi:hypothetical protein
MTTIASAGFAATLVTAGPAAAQPQVGQGLERERSEAIERLRQEQLERDQRTLIEREQAVRDSGRRLDALKQQLRQPPLPPPTPGTPDRPAEMMRNEALRQQQQEYDRALQQRDAAERAVIDSGGRAAPWRPTGANAR